MAKASFLLITVVVVSVAILMAMEADAQKKKRPPPDDVYFERNMTCVKRNSGKRSKPNRISTTTVCRCKEKMWQRCVVRGSSATTAAPGTNGTTNGTAPATNGTAPDTNSTAPMPAPATNTTG